MMRIHRFLCLLCLVSTSCSTAYRQTRDLVAQGEIRAAAQSADDDYRALREVSFAIINSALANETTRYEAIRGLGDLGSIGVPLLERHLESDDETLALLSASALLKTGEGDINMLRDFIRHHLEGSDLQSRSYALSVLALVDRELLVQQMGSAEEAQRISALSALTRFEPQPDLIPLLVDRVNTDPSSSVRARALRILARWGQGTDLVELGQQAIGQDSLNLQLAGIEALKRAENRQRAIDVLSSLLSREEPDVLSVRAATLLARWDDPRGIEALQEALLDDDALIASTAALCAGQVGESMVEPLVGASEGQPAEVQLQIAASLVRLGEQQRSVDILSDLLNEPRWIGLHAALILTKTGDQCGLLRLRSYLFHHDIEIRAYACRACAFFPEGLEIARMCLEDENLRVQLVAAFSVLKHLSVIGG